MSLNRNPREDVFNFRRDDIASFVSANGDIEYAASDTIRNTYDPTSGKPTGILLENRATNYVRDSLNPKAQSIPLTVGDYVLSFYGTGHIELTLPGEPMVEVGAAHPFSLVADGTIEIVPVGSVKGVQVEDGEVPTSLIPTPENAVGVREGDRFTHTRNKGFAPTTGTFIGDFTCNVIEPGKTYFSVVDDAGARLFSLIGNTARSFTFVAGTSSEDLTGLPENGDVKFAIVYDQRADYTRLFLNEEATELPFPLSGTVSGVQFGYGDDSDQSAKVVFRRYQYRPKALNVREISSIFKFKFELGYDYGGPPPIDVNNWADSIFAASTFKF